MCLWLHVFVPERLKKNINIGLDDNSSHIFGMFLSEEEDKKEQKEWKGREEGVWDFERNLNMTERSERECTLTFLKVYPTWVGPVVLVWDWGVCSSSRSRFDYLRKWVKKYLYQLWYKYHISPIFFGVKNVIFTLMNV